MTSQDYIMTIELNQYLQKITTTAIIIGDYVFQAYLYLNYSVHPNYESYFYVLFYKYRYYGIPYLNLCSSLKFPRKFNLQYYTLYT